MDLRRLAFRLLALGLCACRSSPPPDDAADPRAARPSGAARPAPLDVCPGLLAGISTPAVLPADTPVRFVAFGDFGDGSPAQRAVARAMARVDAARPFDFGVTLGDNFYEQGLADPASPRWQSQWETLYGLPDIRRYASLGNHDHYDEASPAAEHERSRRSATWCLPSPFYYTFAAGPVQLFALDTDPIERRDVASAREQAAWLDRALSTSGATWKVVYGHHPIYSSGLHGDSAALGTTILPVLEKRGADLYLAGHDHDLEIQRPAGGVTFAIAGAAGHELRALGERSRCSAWAAGRTPGFAVVEATAESLSIEFVGTGGRDLYRTEIRKGERRDCSR